MNTETPVNSVKVRMYRHGFGDCFLLSFFQGDDRVWTMLIDCGIKHNTRSKDVPIEDVIQDLTETLTPPGGRKPVVDVLVASHEHWDHISFFHPKRTPDFFSKFSIGQVWLAWTENPDDDEAVAINSRLRKGVTALQIAAAELKAAEAAEARQFRNQFVGGSVAAARARFNGQMEDVLGFYGMAALSRVSQSGIRYKTKPKVSTDTEVAMNRLIELGEKGGGIRYFSPGKTIDRRLLPPGINIYVLGPPRSSMINKSNPSSGANHETYFGIEQSGLAGFMDALLPADSSGGNGTATTSSPGPFHPRCSVAPDHAKKDDWFSGTYFYAKEKYRQIESSWLDVAGQFALQLDGAINNTSLVLAIELAESGKVLLFPGDAQVGSWLSWHDHKWKVKRGSTTESINAEELLNNTVLYKVSHHGSHNATIRDKGLEMMTHPDLVAMIPEKEDSYNGILYEPLIERLNELCRGRVIVSADVNHPPEDLLKHKPSGMTTAEWKAFKQDLTIEPLYVEYTVR
jgi:hypothetical protein